MATITWLHLSDLHFRAEELRAWNEDIVLRALLADLRQQMGEGLSPDLILVSGDIAFSGKPAEYALARPFFDELLAATGLPKGRLFLVPGNHDVDRRLVSFPARATAAALTDRDATNEVLADPQSRQLMLAPFQGYAAFINDYFEHLSFDDDRYFYVHPVNLDDRSVAILGLNSAWLAQGDGDRNRLAMGECQVRAALEKARSADLCLALLHHPFDWLQDFDRADAETPLSRECDFVLHGHMHQVGLLQARTPDSYAFVVAAGACYETRQHPNAYNYVQIDPVTSQGAVHLRTYSDRGGGFWTTDTTNYRNVPDGVYRFSLRGEPVSPQLPERPPPRMPATDPAKLESAYLRKVQLSCNALPLALIDPRAVERTRQRTMELLAVYVALATQTQVLDEKEGAEGSVPRRRAEQAGADEGPDGLGELLSDGETRFLSALESVDRERQMVLLGDPGGGKSTFANYLALCLAGARLEELQEPAELLADTWLAHLQGAWRHGPLLPLRVTLRHFAASQHCDGTAAGLWAFIVESLVADGLADFAALLRQRLLDGGVLLVCDGLDEVADEEDRRAVQDAVAGLATTYNHPANRYLVTCRIYAYQDPCWHLEGFAAHTLAPFNQEQVDAFVDCWYREACRLGWKTEAEAGALTQGLQAATRRADLAPLARSPLQLTMMASLHFSWGRLPDDRAELYQQMVDLLLVRWQEARLGEGTGLIEALTAGELVSALEQVAFEAHRAQGTSEGPADLSEAALLSVLVDSLGGSWGRAQELLAYIRERAGLLLEREPGVYTFPHRSYQEYLAGSYLAREPDFPDLAADLVRDNYSQWREVVLWAVGIMARLKRMTHVAVGVADALCPPPLPQAGTGWRAAHLAGEALLETGLVKVRARERHAQVLDRVQARLVALLEENALPARERAAAGNTLSDLDDPRFRAEAWFLPDEPLFGFVPVPAGPFLMGTREDDIPALLERFGGERGWYEREVPQHTVELPDYYIARYPVTVAQFRAFAQDSGHKPGREASLPGLSAGGLPNHPVVNVTWYDAVAYSQWLAEQLRGFDFGLWMANLTDDALTAQSQDLRDRIQDQGWQVRLPSEAEWEKAARGMEERFFPWGDDVDPDRANYFDTRIGATSAVGCFSGGASPYGVLDLGGNVWEWTQSLYRDYPYNLTDGREELDDNGSRVLRGGAFHYNGWRVRCAFRFRYYPRRRFNVFGFRVVVAPG